MILRPVAPPVEYGITKRLARAGNAAIALLRSLGTNAHVWLPGANGVSVASLPSNNYLLSDGSTGYSTVDGVDGLDLDGMGSLGSELVTNGTFDTDTTWTKGAGWTIAGEAAVATGVTAFVAIKQSATLSAGKTYLVTYTVSSVSSGGVRVTFFGGAGVAGVDRIAPGTYSEFMVAVAGSNEIGFQAAGAGFAGSVDNISVKEYTGTHLTQPTTANKPLVRRGMLNELLNSATPATQSVTCIAAPYTLALYGTGNVVLSGTGAGTLTGTGASDLVVLNFTPTAGSVTFTKAGTVSSFGLFKGTWTAAQILAEGGIPTTTATAASNPSAGKYWWSFDGSNDSLLSGNLGITNACTIVIAGRVNSLAATQMLFAETTNGVQVSIATDGSVSLTKVGGAALVATAAGVVVAGVPFVLTARLSAGTADIRKNGAQSATAAKRNSFAALPAQGSALPSMARPETGGALGWVVPLPSTIRR
jgi:hypothetical protein